jgi:putative DNA primase/helicase
MRDARCVVFDEAEAETAVAKARIQGILDLVRQSSSEGGATIAKGTQSQTGAKNYEVRSCFMFSSINVSLEHFADESRVTILELRNPAGRDPAALAAFDALVARVNSSITPEFCAGFVARSVRMMPVILRNAETFARAVATHLGSSRVGDQIGTLLAGAFSLTSDRVVSPEAARKWVEAQCWDDTTTADAAPDERRMLDHLMQQRAKLDLGAGRTEDLMLGEIVLMASGKNGDAVAAFAQAELKRHGMKYEENTDELKRHGITAKAGVWVSNTHDALKKHFHGTQWSAKWERTLRRLPGTKALERGEAAIRFAGSRDRATFVPLDLIE